ncbi:MAG: phage protease [Akkermansia sp.]
MSNFYRAAYFATAEFDGTDDIQLFPPGIHDISPMGEEGKPAELKVRIDEKTAEAIEKARAEYQKEADEGKGDSPYLDFNHDDGAASALVKSIFWGGDDPKIGGVRAVVEWTKAGADAVEGKMYRRISPAFFCGKPDADGVRDVIAAPPNMGGLVNKAAFRTIQPLFQGRDASEKTDKTQTETTMSDQEIIGVLQEELAALKSQNEELNKQLETMQAKDAENTVCKAVEEGKITPSEEVKAKWVGLILKDPTAKEILASLPVNPAFKAAYKPEDNKDNGGTGKAIMAKYDAIKDPAERYEFFRDNEKELIKARGK